MDSKEKQFKENEAVNSDMIAQSLKATGRERKRHDSRKTNRLWLWLGVLVLVAILLWWIFTFGLIGDAQGTFNG